MANPTLPRKDDLVGNPTAGTFKTALGQFFDYVSGSVAGMIPNTPAGNITATDMQSAINELDSKKVNINGGTMTGTLTIPNGLSIVSTGGAKIGSGPQGTTPWVQPASSAATDFLVNDSSGNSVFVVQGESGSAAATLNGANILTTATGAPAGYGLGTTAKDISGQNLDILRYSGCGFYKGQNVTNAPTTSWWYFVVITHDNTRWTTVEAIDYFSMNRYISRWYDNNGSLGWTGWTQVLTSSTPYIVAESLGTTGYRKWSDSFTEQWGVASGGGPIFYITFPLAFSSACYSFVATQNTPSNGTDNMYSTKVHSVSTTTAYLYANCGSVYWYAVGK
ncbi:Hypothetical protein LUCI_4956 [Lucifera butyrica]|uniref:Putative tail fiber protein gp53-like C-terminal domain-containing protein n=1 Tax=Lucifera butyrica TaxID=1351585 RepID=A0A498RKR8_9FIRM|nr:hypothetical protein [Lucifera butyrica]VBB09658.1 Hypothetical protein LUCI_4956 [Lucifera butyrica]